MLTVTRKSTLSGVERSKDLNITQEALDKWERGEGLVQNLFPGLTPNDREFIMTGITPEEWDDLFKEDLENDKASGPSDSTPV